MRSYTRIVQVITFGAFFVLPAYALHAQTAVNPSGHWDGKIEVPGMDVNVEVDLTKNSVGAYEGTVGMPAQHLRGLPLVKIAVEGKTITLAARSDQTMTGDLSDDGKTMSGTFVGAGGSVPFILTRTGDAKVTPPVTSAPIGKDLEGTWTTTVEDTGNRVALTLTNHADGTATGSLINESEGGLQIPVRITQKGSSVTFETAVVAGSFAGTLNASGTKMTGTWTEGTVSKAVTFMKK